MSSIKETRNLLSVSCVTGIINANEFAILYVNISVRQLWRILTGQFQQRKMHSRISGWEKLFACFGRCPLFHCLKEGLCILFKRLAYHSRYNDMIPRFGRPVPEISIMTSVVLDWIYNEHGHHLTHFNQFFLFRASLRTYADAIHQKGVALNNCWGFVDGTVCPICHPLKNQWPIYNSHKRVHALKF